MIIRKDMPVFHEGIQVIQLTEEECGACHVYMEAQVFFPCSSKFILHRCATAHGADRNNPGHRYLLCDINNGCSLETLTEETGTTGPAVSPDGRYFYYFVDETRLNGGRLILKRIDFSVSRKAEVIMVLDSPLPGTSTIPSRIYSLSTISSDGCRIAISGFLGDGRTERAPWGLMVLDVEKGTVSVVKQGPEWINMHPQYCRSTDILHSRDIMIQENHGSSVEKDGSRKELVSGDGADIHLIRDDGSNFRTFPWGRDGMEFCTGHECWRGRSDWAIASVWYRDNEDARLLESRGIEGSGHAGLQTPGGKRNDLSRSFDKPGFGHFSTDIGGRLLVSDYFLRDIYIAKLGVEGKMAASDWTRIADSCSSRSKASHIHPFLSPDGKKAFFNSDQTGVLQAYMITGIENAGL